MSKFFVPIFLILLALISNANGQDSTAPQKGYSTDLLREPIFSEARVAVEAVQLNNWLNANIEKLTYEAQKGPREHLYYLIDSRIKQIYAKDQKILPKEPDPILEELFYWAEPLSVYGGGLVFDAIQSPPSPELKKRLTIPDSFSLTLDGDLFTIESNEQGWHVKIPYYFMIGRMNDQILSNNERTQLIVISTGTAKHKDQPGYSQATLMFMFSPGVALDGFSAYWRGLLQIGDESEKVRLESGAHITLHQFDADLKLHKEFTAWEEPQGSFAIAYFGLDGTYQWNRQHFLDF